MGRKYSFLDEFLRTWRDDLGETFEGVRIHTCTHRNEGEKKEKRRWKKFHPLYYYGIPFLTAIL